MYLCSQISPNAPTYFHIVAKEFSSNSGPTSPGTLTGTSVLEPADSTNHGPGNVLLIQEGISDPTNPSAGCHNQLFELALFEKITVGL